MTVTKISLQKQKVVRKNFPPQKQGLRDKNCHQDHVQDVEHYTGVTNACTKTESVIDALAWAISPLIVEANPEKNL